VSAGTDTISRMTRPTTAPVRPLLLAAILALLCALGLGSRAHAQGAIGVEARAEDEGLARLLASINDPKSRREVTLERAFLTVLDGSCKTPIAGYARTTPEGRILFEGCALSPDGRTRYDVTREADARDLAAAAALGHAAGEELLARAGRAFFQV